MRGTAAILAACTALALSSCGGAGKGPVTLDVVPNQPDTRIVVDADTERTDIQIFSPRGIGGADAEFTSTTLPKRVVLRFHLRGLEELRFAYGSIVVTASVPSAGGALRQSRGSAEAGGAQEQPIGETSPYWMAIRVVPGAAAPAATPPQDGYIEVDAPQDFLTAGQRKFTFHWIDFYR